MSMQTCCGVIWIQHLIYLSRSSSKGGHILEASLAKMWRRKKLTVEGTKYCRWFCKCQLFAKWSWIICGAWQQQESFAKFKSQTFELNICDKHHKFNISVDHKILSTYLKLCKILIGGLYFTNSSCVWSVCIDTNTFCKAGSAKALERYV